MCETREEANPFEFSHGAMGRCFMGITLRKLTYPDNPHLRSPLPALFPTPAPPNTHTHSTPPSPPPTCSAPRLRRDDTSRYEW